METHPSLHRQITIYFRKILIYIFLIIFSVSCRNQKENNPELVFYATAIQTNYFESDSLQNIVGYCDPPRVYILLKAVNPYTVPIHFPLKTRSDTVSDSRINVFDVNGEKLTSRASKHLGTIASKDTFSVTLYVNLYDIEDSLLIKKLHSLAREISFDYYCSPADSMKFNVLPVPSVRFEKTENFNMVFRDISTLGHCIIWM